MLNTVAAARTLLRRGDAALKPFGVTVQQFSLLAAIRLHEGKPVTSLAQRIHLDRTSLTRNLNLLERKGLVRRNAETVGNVRICTLTEEGNRLFDQLLPVWKGTRTELLKTISVDDAETYLNVARQFISE
ncbi:MAG TPA: MarR family transcriptional regulator [Ochrobactrum sp.]|nr:MarR family transcriptional regulator [Ochrobactrum sp.]